eukprot:351970-Chlamydomonas_euryale.AAC.2
MLAGQVEDGWVCVCACAHMQPGSRVAAVNLPTTGDFYSITVQAPDNKFIDGLLCVVSERNPNVGDIYPDPPAGDVNSNAQRAACPPLPTNPTRATFYRPNSPVFVRRPAVGVPASSARSQPLTAPFPVFSSACNDEFQPGFLIPVPPNQQAVFSECDRTYASDAALQAACEQPFGPLSARYWTESAYLTAPPEATRSSAPVLLTAQAVNATSGELVPAAALTPVWNATERVCRNALQSLNLTFTFTALNATTVGGDVVNGSSLNTVQMAVVVADARAEARLWQQVWNYTGGGGAHAGLWQQVQTLKVCEGNCRFHACGRNGPSLPNIPPPGTPSQPNVDDSPSNARASPYSLASECGCVRLQLVCPPVSFPPPPAVTSRDGCTPLHSSASAPRPPTHPAAPPSTHALAQSLRVDYVQLVGTVAPIVQSWSGNPGYLTGFPVLAGQLTQYVDPALGLLTALRRYTFGFPVPAGSLADGACVAGGLTSARFGSNMTSTCGVALDLAGLRSTCTSGNATSMLSGVLDGFWGTLVGGRVYVGQWGNSDSDAVAQWVPVQLSNTAFAPPIYFDTERACSGLVVGYDVQLVFGVAFASNNLQRKVRARLFFAYLPGAGEGRGPAVLWACRRLRRAARVWRRVCVKQPAAHGVRVVCDAPGGCGDGEGYVGSKQFTQN